MNKFIIIILLFMSFGCTKNKDQAKNAIETAPISAIMEPEITTVLENPQPSNKLDKKDNPYQVTFDIKSTENNRATLEIAMEICDGCYYVSPYSPGNFKGIFTIVLNDNPHLNKDLVLLELPPSKEGIDPWGNGPVNFVKENTLYKQELNIKTQEDFNVSGWVQFVIEPKCTLEKVPFSIVNKSGTLKIGPGGC